MCELVENYAREVAEEEAKAMAKRLLERGVDFDIVCQSVKILSKDELLSIYEKIHLLK